MENSPENSKNSTKCKLKATASVKLSNITAAHAI